MLESNKDLMQFGTRITSIASKLVIHEKDSQESYGYLHLAKKVLIVATTLALNFTHYAHPN